MPLNEEAFIERVLQDMDSRGRSPAARIAGCGQISHFDFSRSGKIEEGAVVTAIDTRLLHFA